jgi:hypothetical protein
MMFEFCLCNVTIYQRSNSSESTKFLVQPAGFTFGVEEGSFHLNTNVTERQTLLTGKLNKIVVSFGQLPTWMDALQTFLPSKLASVLSRNMSVQLFVPAEGRPVLTVNSYKMMLGSAVGTQLQPWLINTQFPPLLRLVTRLGITGNCCSSPVNFSLP